MIDQSLGKSDGPAALRDKLLRMVAGADLHVEPAQPRTVVRGGDAIVTHCEISDRHGVGKYVRMLFLGEPNIVSIRSADLYDGEHDFGDVALRIGHDGATRDAARSRVFDAVGEHTVRRILCVPYGPDDVLNALAIKQIFGVPLCTYIMDDQNIYAKGIPDELMHELLCDSELRLAISPEMCLEYGAKFGRKLWYMPPLAPAALVANRLVPPPPFAQSRQGIIIGNIWGERWVDLLRSTVRDSGVTLTWHSSGEFRWLRCSKRDLMADSIVPADPLPEDVLIRTLRNTQFTVVPTGVLDGSDDRKHLAHLSLPSRITYMMAVSQIPILVLGSRDTAAAHFVEQFGIGMVAGYNRASFEKAVDHITRPEVNLEMRKRALAIAGRFTDAGAGEWIWRSLAGGGAMDARYEDLANGRKPRSDRLPAPGKMR